MHICSNMLGNDRKGFTLVEMSIVLVIIGLIVGGIFVGKDLIEAANIRAQVKQIEKYTLAYNTFKLKYNCRPGDCVNATDFFTGTANGDGDGIVENSINSTSDEVFDYEQARFFQQLSLSSLINEQYNTTATVGIGYPRVSINPSKGIVVGQSFELLSNIVDCITNTLSSDCYALGKWQVAIFIAHGNPNDATWMFRNDIYGILTPAQALNIDQKLDDGMPHTGNMRGGNPWGSYNEDCVTSSSILGTYLLTSTDTACYLAWKIN